MSALKNLAIAITGSLLAASSFAADGVKVALRLESNGKLLGTPVLMTNFGARASVETRGDGNHYRIELVAKDADDAADIAFKLFVDEGRGLKLVSEPRIVSRYDTQASVAQTSKNGAGIRFSVEASRADIAGVK